MRGSPWRRRVLLTAAALACVLGMWLVPVADTWAMTSRHAVAPAGTAATASAIIPGSVGRTSLDLRATYDVAATLGYGDRSLRVDETLIVRNDSAAGIDRLELNTIAARLGNMRRLSASVDGRVVIPTRSDQTIIVPLGGVLPKGASARVYVGYSATLRSTLGGSDWLFTRANGIVDLYRWIPWVSLARPFDRPNSGDPFVTPVSPSVIVRLTTDRSLVVASTGARTAVTGLTQTFSATNVRDFVLTAAPDFHTASRTVGGVFIQAFSRPGISASGRVSIATDVLTAIVSRLGAAPYPRLIVAQSAGGSAMEGPGIIWIPTGVRSADLGYQITHETAHQWFYGMVGNDQALHPFEDEAAADFITRTIRHTFRSSSCATADLDRSIYGYSAACYDEVIYIQGSRFLDGLRQRVGDAAFWPALRGYLATWRWKIAPRTALLDAIDAATPQNLRPLFETRFPAWY